MLEARREVPGERAGNEVTLLLCPAPPRPPGWGMAVPGWWHRMSPPHPPPCPRPRPRPQQVNSTRQVPDTAASSPCQCAQHTLPSWGQVTTATEHFQPHCPSSVPWDCNPLGPSPPHTPAKGSSPKLDRILPAVCPWGHRLWYLLQPPSSWVWGSPRVPHPCLLPLPRCSPRTSCRSCSSGPVAMAEPVSPRLGDAVSGTGCTEAQRGPGAH